MAEKYALQGRNRPMSDIFSTAISGMNAAKDRMMNAAENIANVQTTGQLPNEPGGRATSYYPTDVITLSNDVGDNHLGVRTDTVERPDPYSVVYDPRSTYANEDGLIAAPNIDLTREIVDNIMAELSYKANAKLISVEKSNQETLIDTLV